MITAKFYNTKQIALTMRELPQRMSKREVLDPSLIKGAVVMRDAARELAPVDRGVLKRNIIVQRQSRLDQGIAATVVVRVRKLKAAAIARFKQRAKKRGQSGKRNPNDPFYWRFVEFGTAKMAAKPFLRPAFDSQKEKAVDVAIEELRKKASDLLGKLSKRTLYTKVEDYMMRRSPR